MTRYGRHLPPATARPRAAFSLVEIVVILFIVSLALVGILALIVQNIQSQSYNKNDLIAYQLAQEGVELVRHVRDDNWLASQAFTLGLATTTGVTYQSYMDYRDSAPVACSGACSAAALVLRQDNNGFYFNDPSSAATTSPYSRLILTKQLDADSLQVDAVIGWQDHNRNYSYDLQAILYDWR